MRSLVCAVVLALAGSLPACNKDEPKKPSTDEPKKTTPVPSDMVFNDFLAPTGGGQGLSVRGADGGLEAGVLAAAGGPDEAAAAPEGPGKLRVTDPGAEPRAVRRYAFVANRTDKRLMTMRQTVNTPQGPQEIALAFTVELVPKQVKPTGTHFELKVLKVDLPDAPAAEKAMAAQRFAPLAGLAAGFEVSPQGEIGEIEFKADEKMQSPQVARLAQSVLQGLQQFMELILPPFPGAPIGVGATWESKDERSEGGVKASTSRKFTLKDLSADGGSVVSDIELKVPKTNIPARQGGPTGTLQVDAKGAYTYAFRFDHISSRVEGELVTKQNVEVKGQPPVNETSKAKHLLEPAK